MYHTLIPTTVYCELVDQMGRLRSETPEALQERPTFLPGSLTHSLIVLNVPRPARPPSLGHMTWSPWHPGLGHMPSSDFRVTAWLPGCCSLVSKLESPSCQGQMGFMVGRICAVIQAFWSNKLLTLMPYCCSLEIKIFFQQRPCIFILHWTLQTM